MIQKAKSFTIVIIFSCLSLIGFALVPLLSVQLEPHRYIPTITVRYSVPNHSAAAIEAEVTSKLEALFARMDGTVNISSSSFYGGGTIRISFDKSIDIEVSRLDASAIIRRAWPYLPDGTSYPTININTSNNNKENFLVYSITADEPSFIIQQFAEKHFHALKSIKGVDNVSIDGASPMQWHLYYDPLHLKTLGFTYKDIQHAISAYYQHEYIGMVNTENNGWCQLCVTPERSDSFVNDLEKITLQNKNGDIIRLSNLVNTFHKEESRQSLYRINGQNSIYLTITSDESVNQLRLGKTIKNIVDSLTSKLPEGYEVHKNYDATEYIRQELSTILIRSGLTLLFLILFVLSISQGWKQSIIIFSSLIENLLIAVIIYYLTKIDIHIYSLAGITISLNLIIDNTIITTNHIVTRNNNKIVIPILAATFTSICALSCIMYLDEQLRNNLQDFATVISINLLISLLIAAFFVPAMNDLLQVSPPKHKVQRKRKIVILSKWYEKVIRYNCRHKKSIIAILIFLFGLPVFLLPERMEEDKHWWQKCYNATFGSDIYLKNLRPIINNLFGGTWRLFVEDVYNKSYIDDSEETILHVVATLPNGSTIEQLNNLVVQMEQYLKPISNIKLFQTHIQNNHLATIDIHFPDEHQHSSFPYELKEELVQQAQKLGGGSWNIFGLNDQVFNNDIKEIAGSYRIQLSGYNYNQLNSYALALKDSLLKYHRIKDVQISARFNNYKNSYKEYAMNISSQKLYETMLTPIDMYESLQNYYSKDIVLYQNPTSIGYENVYLSSVKATTNDTWNLSNTPLFKDNKTFNIKSIARTELSQQVSEIRKNNQQYELCIQYDYIGTPQAGRRILENTTNDFKKILPIGYKIQSKMASRGWKEKDAMPYKLVSITICIIFIITSILFNSLRKPWVIIFATPISFIGVFLTFYIFKINFDQGGFAAMILLCGISVNASIYLLHEYSNVLKRSPQRDIYKSYLRAFNRKVTPITLTIVSTILGFIPFIISKDAFWFPLACGCIGGLILAFIGILFILPIYILKK